MINIFAIELFMANLRQNLLIEICTLTRTPEQETILYNEIKYKINKINFNNIYICRYEIQE